MRFAAFAFPIGLALISASASARADDPAAVGRYQLSVRHDMLGDTLFMVDSVTGHTWQLRQVPVPLPDGSTGSVERWFPLDVADSPAPPESAPQPTTHR